MLKKKTMEHSQSRGTKMTPKKVSSTTSQKKTSTKSSATMPKKSSPQQKLEENLKTLTSTLPRKKTGKTSGKKKKTDIVSVRSFDKKLFPYGDTFPYRLQDKRDDKLCWFVCMEHAEKYITRYNMLPKEYRLSYNFHVVGTKET